MRSGMKMRRTPGLGVDGKGTHSRESSSQQADGGLVAAMSVWVSWELSVKTGLDTQAFYDGKAHEGNWELVFSCFPSYFPLFLIYK